MCVKQYWKQCEFQKYLLEAVKTTATATQSLKFKLLHYSQSFDIFLKLPRLLNQLLSCIWSAAWHAVLRIRSEICQVLFIDLYEVYKVSETSKGKTKHSHLQYSPSLQAVSERKGKFSTYSVWLTFCQVCVWGGIQMHSTENQHTVIQNFHIIDLKSGLSSDFLNHINTSKAGGKTSTTSV